MLKITFIGGKKEHAEQIVGCLLKLIPQDMADVVCMAYSDDTPYYIVCGEPAPHVIVRTSDKEQAIRVKDTIQNLDCVDGPLDVEIEMVEFFEGGGKMPETETDGSR